MMIDQEPQAAETAFTATMRDGVLWVEWFAGTSVGDTDATALIQRADVAGPLLAHGQRSGVRQMGASGFHDIRPENRLGVERVAQPAQ